MADITKRDYRLDDDTLLSAWGFSSSSCAKCGTPNSELEGLLIQCGKCKMAYYCSMKCFNGDLMTHRKFCTTTPWDKNPVNKPETPIVEPRSNPLPPRRARKQPDEPVRKVVEEPSDDSSVSSSSSSSSDSSESSKESIDFVQEEEEKYTVEEEADVEEAAEDVTEAEPIVVVHDEEEDTEDEEEASGRMGFVPIGEGEDDGSQSQGRRNPLINRGKGRMIPEPTQFERELVTLRGVSGHDPREYGWERPHWAVGSSSFRELAEYEPRQFDWQKPEWALNSPLRKTLMGEIVKTRGDIRRASLPGSSTACSGGESTRHRHLPEWVLKSPLRKTPRSDLIKNGGKLEKPTTHIREFLEKTSLTGSKNFSLNGSKDLSLNDSKDSFA